MIKKLLLASTVISSMCLSGAAFADWKDMNTDVNATNFIIMINDHPACTGTLISLKYKLVLTANHCLGENIKTEEKEEVNDSGVVNKVTREVFTDVPLQQKSYQGFRNVGETSYLSVIAAHKKSYDLGLLQIRADSIPQTIYSHVLPADKQVQRGDVVFAIGNPRGLDASVSKGIISSTTRMTKVEWADAEVPFYQIDAAINPGNSGGSLYNSDGQLIGLPDSKIAGGDGGLGFAIPVDLIRTFLNENCYEDVWNDKATKTHEQCMTDRHDIENKRREKAGLPPISEEKSQSDMSSSPKNSLLRLNTLDVKEGKEIPNKCVAFPGFDVWCDTSDLRVK
jgi:V8-like Glu-specific endopeptidase